MIESFGIVQSFLDVKKVSRMLEEWCQNDAFRRENKHEIHCAWCGRL